MNNSELLHNLFDRSLDSHQEERLFMELASNDELRSELKQFIDMEFAVRNDFEAFQPAPESQDKIFGALGISTAALTSGAVATSALTYGGWMSKYLNHFLLSIGSLLLGGLMTFLLMNGLQNSEEYNYSGNGKSSLNNTSSALSNVAKNPNIAKTESYLIDTIYKERVIVKYLPGPERIVYLQNDEATNSNENLAQITLSNHINSSMNLNSNIENNSQNTRSISNTGNIYSPLALTDVGDLFSDRLSMEIKANEDWSLPKADMPRSSYPIFNNTSASLFFKVYDDFHIGADFRQEYFYQEYDGMDADNKGYNYYQHTNYISYGILARYSLINNPNTVVFIQPAVSFNQVGIVGRAMLGAEYKLVDKVSVVLGLEGSLLQFNHQGNNFYSPKVGFHYGVRINP
ncbi:MAG: hypothetical protein WC055_15650 [Melioribacteraceae bacterium]